MPVASMAFLLAALVDGTLPDVPGEGLAEDFWNFQDSKEASSSPIGLTCEANLLLGYATFKGQLNGGVGVESGLRVAISPKAFLLLHYRFMHVHDQEDTSSDSGIFTTPGFGEITTDIMDFHDGLLGIGVMTKDSERWGMDLQIETGARYATIHRTSLTVQYGVNVSRDDHEGSGWTVPVVAAGVVHYHALPELNVNLGFWMDTSLLHGFGSNHGVEVGFGFQFGLEGRF